MSKKAANEERAKSGVPSNGVGGAFLALGKICVKGNEEILDHIQLEDVSKTHGQLSQLLRHFRK